MRSEALFRPFHLKSLHLKNRIVMSPMTRSMSKDGVPPPEAPAYYARRAQGGAGLVTSEGTVIDRPSSSKDPGVPHFYGEKALARWKEVADAVHAAGGKMAMQLWHVGISRPYKGDWRPSKPFEGPSGFLKANEPSGVAMSENDIADTIAAFARAAADVKRLGFDAVEMHGAHGFLIDQFFWDEVNVRTDRYGGKTLGERARFAAELVKGVRKAVAEDFVISLRLSQWKIQNYDAKLAKTPQEMAEWLTPLADAGVDIFHCSTRRYWEPEFEGSDLNFAGWAKKLTGKASTTVGAVGLSRDHWTSTRGGEAAAPASLDELERRLDRGEFDLVAVGRAILADHEWANKIREGLSHELRGYTTTALEKLF